MLITGFWASKDVLIYEFTVKTLGATFKPKFRKTITEKGEAVYRFDSPLKITRDSKLSWKSWAAFEAAVSPIFEPENEAEKKLLEAKGYADPWRKLKEAF